MQTLQRTVAALIFPAIAYLGAACERTDTPTEAGLPGGAFQLSSATVHHWVNDDDPNLGGYAPPGTSCTDPGYSTIGAAVAAALSGETIGVCAGLYPELVGVNKTLTLLGEQVGVDARTRAVPLTSESVVGSPDGAFQILANNVIIDGFTIEGVIANPSAPPFSGLGAGIWTNPGFSLTNGGHQIRNNIIQLNIIGIFLNNDGTFQTMVERNRLQNNNFPGPAGGTGIYSDLGLVDAIIQENTFAGPHTSRSITLVGPLIGNPQSMIDILNNAFDQGGGSGVGFCGTTDMLIMGNTSLGSAAGSTIGVGGGNTDVLIELNNLQNGQRGIRVSDVCGLGPNVNVQAHVNNIESNAVAGLQVDPSPPLAHVGTMNAECNWWGSPTGPFNATMNPTGTGNQVTGDADFIPWLIAPAPGGACFGGGPAGKATGGGQIDVGSRGSFGFNAKSDGGLGSGHLNYLNHSTGAHLDCTVDAVLINGTTAKFSGPCSPKSAASSFEAEVEDVKEPGKGADKFKITYGSTTEGNTISRGNIQIK